MDIVVIGAGYAGALAANRLARKAPEVAVTVVNPRPDFIERVRLHEQLADSALVTHEGDGHTAYMRQNDCVDKAVDRYWLTGELPEGGELTCEE